jgi:hypothetical protein
MTTPDPPDEPREPTIRPIGELIDSWLAGLGRRRAPTLRAERVVQQSPVAWPRWHVHDENDAIVGAIAEEREWLGHAYGPTIYAAVYNPGLRPWKARWRAESSLPRQSLSRGDIRAIPWLKGSSLSRTPGWAPTLDA